MGRKILIIQGHPDANHGHFGDALANRYEQGAVAGGHEIRKITVAELDFPLLRSMAVWQHEAPVPAIRDAQEAIRWAEHLVILYPLWLGSMPALLKAFLEQVMRPGFGIEASGTGGMWKHMLSGRSARVVVTMGMPAFAYRWIFRAHSLKSLERNILKFCGIAPVRAMLIGMVEGSQADREKALAKLEKLGRLAM